MKVKHFWRYGWLAFVSAVNREDAIIQVLEKLQDVAEANASIRHGSDKEKFQYKADSYKTAIDVIRSIERI